jgi:misacylated tRNA(Ala) deacylase
MKANIDPKMHSAEHILNQTMVRMFGCNRSFSAHVEKKKSKCDYRFDRFLTAEEILELEKRVNQVIQNDFPVAFETMPVDQAKKLFGAKTPEGYEQIRIVKIGDYDAIPCIGAHVDTTKKIGKFKIISSDFNEGVLRIRYKLN